MAKSSTPRYMVYAKDRAEWRTWLERNHRTSDGVSLIYYRKGQATRSVSPSEAAEEALCFGWYAGSIDALDAVRYTQLMAPRKPKSAWSKLDRQRIARVMKQGLMTSAGLQKVEEAQHDGSWAKLIVTEDRELPQDLLDALATNQCAYSHFMAFKPSEQKSIVRWIDNAKRPETRVKRIQEVATLAARNIRAYPYRS